MEFTVRVTVHMPAIDQGATQAVLAELLRVDQTADLAPGPDPSLYTFWTAVEAASPEVAVARAIERLREAVRTSHERADISYVSVEAYPAFDRFAELVG